MFEVLGILSFLCTLVMLVISINPKWITRGKLQKRKHTLVTALVMFVLFVTFAVNDPSANTKPAMSPNISSSTSISSDASSTKQPSTEQQTLPKAPAPVTPKAVVSSPATSTTAPAPTVAPNPTPTPAAAATSTAVHSPTTPAISTPSPVPKQTNQDVIVYITKTGKKYHRDGCRYLSRSKIAISLKDAESEGYTPCSVCDPPQ